MRKVAGVISPDWERSTWVHRSTRVWVSQDQKAAFPTVSTTRFEGKKRLISRVNPLWMSSSSSNCRLRSSSRC